MCLSTTDINSKAWAATSIMCTCHAVLCTRTPDMMLTASGYAQARYVSGTFILNPEGPYRTLDQLWDGEVSDINRKQAQAAGF